MPTCGDTDKSGGLSASSRSAWIAGSSPATTTIYFFIYFLPCGSALAFTCASSLPSLSIADLSAAISRGGEIAGSGGDFRIGLAVELERLLQKLDIGLQAGGAAIHLLLGGADLEPANVLRRGRGDSAAGSIAAASAKLRSSGGQDSRGRARRITSHSHRHITSY
jgi:hypothetical protein